MSIDLRTADLIAVTERSPGGQSEKRPQYATASLAGSPGRKGDSPRPLAGSADYSLPEML